MILLALVTVLVSLILFWRSRVYKFWRKYNVPFPEPIFPIGNLGSILGLKLHTGVVFQEWYKKYKYNAWIGYFSITKPAILVRDLDLIKDMLMQNFNCFSDNGITFENDDLMANHPFVLVGEPWKAARKILSPLFTLNRCKLLFPLMQPAIHRMTEYLDKNGADHVYDAKKLSCQFTTENVVKCGYSMDAGCFVNPDNEFRSMEKKIFQPTFSAGIKFIIALFVPAVARVLKFRYFPQNISVWLSAVLKNNIEERKKTPLPYEDLLQWLLNGIDGKKLDEKEAISRAFSFFIEGFETSSGVMALTLYSLAKNPHIQDKLRDEIYDSLGRHDNEFTFDALQDMFYLDCVVNETLRMYPPGLVMSRICTKPFEMPILKEHQTRPFICQPGMKVSFPVYAIHMDEDIYPEPHTFDPLRFSEEGRKKRHKAAFLPFGEGPRICLGAKFAMTQVKLAVGHLIKDFVVTLESPKGEIQINPAGLLFQSKEDLMLKFKRCPKIDYP